MSKLFMFEKPIGMRDTLPHIYETKKKIKDQIGQEFKLAGYQFIETPALEYYETVGTASAILDQQLFKLLDQQGHTLVLRPDMTTPIARMAASKLLKEQIPIRLAYCANVYRAQQREGGRAAEFEQIGIENIGDPTISADGEIIALLVSSLKKTGLKHFQISIGHIGFVRNLFQQILGTEERASVLQSYLYEKNYVGYKEHVKQLSLSSIDKQRLLNILNMRGTENVLQEAISLTEDGKGQGAIDELKQLWLVLKDHGVESFVKFDLSLVSHMSYYTGILFEIYAEGVGYPIGNGGRYNNLLEKFGFPTSATGFGIRLDFLLEAIGELSEEEPMQCVLFSKERRKEAIDFAKSLQEKGERTVLQDISGVQDVDRFTVKFSKVHFYIGTPKTEVEE
ncbi:ATP phosphoribosyltransferase regulatory subunit [Bacillus smithii]|uniref:ATP phosphoribosyltransferase regulatory subunit n=1 Tax=Bacillus smithii 7_3_47FAA TaxID=665952 RepID=G9QJS2_9BACI|nr:ATP phosphoribosyltransferase regulatory subunit [Bacillus smithii]EHL78602.1 ATP phosphoribosyltransferase, regulatory subunit [Bacillus smithii 7_3_47FAA]